MIREDAILAELKASASGCRHCGSPLSLQMIDLGASPPSNAFNATQDVQERHYPLRVMVCTHCWLAQTDISLFELNYDQLFTHEYPYYSSTSKGWVEHARSFVEMATERFKLGPDSLTVEVGSNDGYLLQFLKTPCYGVEPTFTGQKASEKGILSFPQFFSSRWAENAIHLAIGTGASKSGTTKRLGKADLMICNNVLAHVPDINDFVKGFATLLKDEGVAVFEFPWLLNLIRHKQFDTIYHEHYSYLSFTAVNAILERQGLIAFDVEKIPTHGGSLRVYASKQPRFKADKPVTMLLAEEGAAGMWTEGFYEGFQKKAEEVKNEFLAFLLRAKEMRRSVAGFGAAAKGNTLLNFSGVRADLISHVVDETPAKQGKFLPGSRIPVIPEFQGKPDYIVVFPWNFREEITKKLEYTREWGAKFVFVIPKLEIA